MGTFFGAVIAGALGSQLANKVTTETLILLGFLVLAGLYLIYHLSRPLYLMVKE